MKILLGSNSPRRKELLQSLGFDFEVVSIDCDEVFPENLSVENIAGYLSELKAMLTKIYKKMKCYSLLTRLLALKEKFSESLKIGKKL